MSFKIQAGAEQSSPFWQGNSALAQLFGAWPVVGLFQILAWEAAACWRRLDEAADGT